MKYYKALNQAGLLDVDQVEDMLDDFEITLKNLARYSLVMFGIPENIRSQFRDTCDKYESRNRSTQSPSQDLSSV